jgi:hypothetical protein
MKAYLLAEARLALGRRHAVLIVALVAIQVLNSVVMPAVPPQLLGFFHRAFHLPTTLEVIVFNCLVLVFQGTFWIGLFELFPVYIVPAEERALALYLTKPLSRGAYLLGRLLPRLGLVGAVGAATALGGLVSVRALNGPLPAGPYLSAAAVAVALAIFFLLAANLAFLFVAESGQALLLAFALWLPVELPLSVFIYRPDLWVGREGLRDAIIFPLNLLWAGEAIVGWAPPLVGALLLGSALLCAAAVVRLGRADLAA